MVLVSKSEATDSKGKVKKGYMMKEAKNGRVLYMSNKPAMRKKKEEVKEDVKAKAKAKKPRKKKAMDDETDEQIDVLPSLTVSMDV